MFNYIKGVSWTIITGIISYPIFVLILLIIAVIFPIYFIYQDIVERIQHLKYERDNS